MEWILSIINWVLILFGIKEKEPQIMPMLQPWPEQRLYKPALPKETQRIERDEQTYALRDGLWFLIFWEEDESSLELYIGTEEILQWLPKTVADEWMVTDNTKWAWLQCSISGAHIPFYHNSTPGFRSTMDYHQPKYPYYFADRSIIDQQLCNINNNHSELRQMVEKQMCDISRCCCDTQSFMLQIADTPQAERIERGYLNGIQSRTKL